MMIIKVNTINVSTMMTSIPTWVLLAMKITVSIRTSLAGCQPTT